MNANVSIYQDSIRDSSGILTSESNEIGSLKIIMPDKLNQLTARSSYICHIDDFVKGNKDYYGFDIQSDSERENTIRTGNIDFKIIAFVGRDIENELHSKFEIKRMEREWFHLSDNDIDNIINEYGFIRVRNSVKDKKI